MNDNWFLEQITFESALQPGQIVEARWTHSHRHYVAQAEVVRVNGSSLRVRLGKALTYAGSGEIAYAEGREIVVPRVTNAKGWPIREFSTNNGAFPIEAAA